MTEQNLLNEPTGEDNTAVDENVNYLEQLVGDNKKFKDVNDLAKGKARSDEYIRLLESRLDALRDDYLKVREENVAGPKLQELLDRLEAKEQELASRSNTQIPNEVNQQPTLDLTKIDSLVSDRLEKFQQTQKQAENYRQVESKLSERFGNNYKSVLKDQAKQLGLSDDEVNSMARNNPKLFFKTFDVETRQGETFQAPPRSVQRSDNFAPQSQKRTWSYYENLRKQNPVAWVSDPKIRIQMDKDAQTLGEAFYDV